VLATNVPEQPSPATVSIQNQNIKITWTAPFDNHADITSYHVSIAESGTEIYREELVYCEPGNSEVTALTNCLMPMAHIRQAPFNLMYD
jgi:hypothetical protein